MTWMGSNPQFRAGVDALQALSPLSEQVDTPKVVWSSEVVIFFLIVMKCKLTAQEETT